MRRRVLLTVPSLTLRRPHLPLQRRYATNTSAPPPTANASAVKPNSLATNLTCRVLSSPAFYQGTTKFAWNSDILTKNRPVIHQSLAAIAMPSGYPQSCAPGYARYFYLYVLHAFVSNFSMSIATQALLGGFFAESTPQVWMLKDLAPSVVAAYFANRVASYESRPKYWLLVAVALSQGASILDLLIPCVVDPEHLLGAAIFSAVIKSNAVLMHFVARASVLQHFAIYQNLGEIQKKLNSAGMINFPIATALGIGFSTLFPSFAVQAAAVGLCSVAAVALVHASLSHVAFRSITPLTGQIVFEKFIATNYSEVETLEFAEQRLGTAARLTDNKYIEEHFVVNPPLSNINPSLEGTLLSGDSLDFTIGLWNPKRTTFYSKMRGVVGQPRLVLLVHRSCQPRQLYLAHLLCYVALSEAKKGFEVSPKAWEISIRSFFNEKIVSDLSSSPSLTTALEEAKVMCANNTTMTSEQSHSSPAMVWSIRTAKFINLLKVEGWDAETPLLDDFGKRIALEPSQ